MRIHILGICGTFMAGLAMLAKEQGHKVTGSDNNVYPPMSKQLAACGIKVLAGYDPAHLNKVKPDIIIIGNVITRGNPLLEIILDKNLPYISGPQWLYENVLKDRHVIGVAGTHGKTTVSSMIAWILERAGLQPGFLIGGAPENFDVSARLGKSPYFVIEADEYDTAFFDKRSKFMHYHPNTLVLNNLEFDHADIFENLDAIKKQFHHLLRTLACNGLIISNELDKNLQDVLHLGFWTSVEHFNDEQGWHAENISNGGKSFDVCFEKQHYGYIQWNLLGDFNIENALAAIAVAHHLDIPFKTIAEALESFKNVKRRMEEVIKTDTLTVYNDFAHHPTAIEKTLHGLREYVGEERIIVVLELGSYTMHHGYHQDTLMQALQEADLVLVKNPKNRDWDFKKMVKASSLPAKIYNDVDAIVDGLKAEVRAKDHVLIMSNTSFGGEVIDKMKTVVV